MLRALLVVLVTVSVTLSGCNEDNKGATVRKFLYRNTTGSMKLVEFPGHSVRVSFLPGQQMELGVTIPDGQELVSLNVLNEKGDELGIVTVHRDARMEICWW